MHEAIKNSRDLVILFTRDYEASPYTRKEFTSFEAERHQAGRTSHRRLALRGCAAARPSGRQCLSGPGRRHRSRGAQTPDPRRCGAPVGGAAAPTTKGQTFVGVPPRIAVFTGRTEALDRLDAILTHDKPAAVTQVGRAAVQGMGGVGKTSLAVEYAHRFRNLYDGVWWCPAETRTGLMTSLAALAAEFEVASPEEADIEKAAKAALRRLAEQREIWLLVYDNVAAPNEIADLCPPPARGS